MAISFGLLEATFHFFLKAEILGGRSLPRTNYTQEETQKVNTANRKRRALCVMVDKIDFSVVSTISFTSS
jgi:hypothetical protein